jgi:hypothetical protein
MLTIKIHHDADGVMFEILDMADVVRDLPESLHLSDVVVKVETAEKQGAIWIKRFQKATEAIKRKMCGYTADGTPTTPITTPVTKCASKTASS